MAWILKKFGWVISLTGLFVGLLFLPADVLDLENAVRVWDKIFTVGNREIVLSVLCVICLLRLGYLDLKRSLNDKDWPPVRKKILAFLRIIFRRDEREARFKLIADDKGVVAYKGAILAKHALESGNFTHLALMAPPSPTPPPPGFTGDIFGEHLINRDRQICDRLNWLGMTVGGDAAAFEVKARERLRVSRHRAYEQKAAWPTFENGGYFATEYARNKFHELRCETDELNRIIDDFSRILHQKKNWAGAIDAETRRRLLADIAEDM